MAAGRERRKKERLHAKLFLEFFSIPLRENLGRGVVVDVSLSGMAIDTEVDLNINDELDCHIEFPLNVRAKVVRRITSGQIKRYGLRMLDQNFIDKLILKKVLKGSRSTRKI